MAASIAPGDTRARVLPCLFSEEYKFERIMEHQSFVSIDANLEIEQELGRVPAIYKASRIHDAVPHAQSEGTCFQEVPSLLCTCKLSKQIAPWGGHLHNPTTWGGWGGRDSRSDIGPFGGRSSVDSAPTAERHDDANNTTTWSLVTGQQTRAW